MASPVESVDVRRLRVTHFEQLLDYLRMREEEGWYYGNKKQFEKRHAELKTWLIDVISSYEGSK